MTQVLNIDRGRAMKAFVMAFFAALAMTFATLFTAPPAQASSCSATGQCIQVSLNAQFVSDLIGSNGWYPVSSSSYGLPPNMSISSQRKMTTAEYQQYCLKSWQDTEGWLTIFNPSTGKYVQFKTFAPTGWAGQLSNGWTSYMCDYPTFNGSKIIMNEGSNAREWKDANGDKSVFFCVLDHSGSVTRSKNSYIGKDATVASLKKTTVTTRENLMIKGLSACKSEYDIDVKYDFPAGLDGYGQYTAKAQANVVACQFLEAYGAKSGIKTYSANCGAAQNRSNEYKMTRWCENGATKFVTGHVSRTWNNCNAVDSGNSGNAKCEVTGKSAVDGANTKFVDVMRDGEWHNFTWGTPRVTGGVSNVRNWEVKTEMVDGSTPYTGSDPNSSRQFFDHKLKTNAQSNGSLGTWYAIPGAGTSPSAVGTDDVKFFKSSDREKPFSLKRTYRYDATMVVETQRIDGIDVMTGKPNVKSSTTTTPVQDAECVAQVSPSVNVMKALNDNL